VDSLLRGIHRPRNEDQNEAKRANPVHVPRKRNRVPTDAKYAPFRARGTRLRRDIHLDETLAGRLNVA